jgi:hypothetical protein
MKYSTLKGFAGAAALALFVISASQSSATTINFATGGNGTTAGGSVAGGLTYTVQATGTGYLNQNGSVASQTVNGLGVNGMPDSQPTLIDNSPGSEMLTITFSWAVKLVNISLGFLDSLDNVYIATNNTPEGHYGPGLTNPVSIGENYVTWFTIRAKEVGARVYGTDRFTLASANVAAVPVPAAGFLLMGALGGLAALRRRKTLTAA